MLRLDEVTKKLDAARKHQQEQIEAHLKELHTSIESIGTELKHAAAGGKSALEAEAKALHEEYAITRKALSESLEAELAEWKVRINAAAALAAEKKADAKTTFQTKIADLHAKHEAAQKKLHSLKQANAAAFGELKGGVKTAIAELKTAVQHARADITSAS